MSRFEAVFGNARGRDEDGDGEEAAVPLDPNIYVTVDGIELQRRADSTDAFIMLENVPYRGLGLVYNPERETDDDGFVWTVSGSFADNENGLDNREIGMQLAQFGMNRSIPVSEDSESGCMFVYTKTLADAKKLVDFLDNPDGPLTESARGRMAAGQV